MRSVYTLYKLVLKEAILRDRGTGYGLCHIIKDAVYCGSISLKEGNKLTEHMKSLRPMRDRQHPFHSLAWNNSYSWLDETNKPWGAYWWNTNEEGKKQRRLFLLALIKYTRPWYIKLWDKIWWF